MRVLFHRHARVELDEAIDFYKEISPSLARGLRDELAAALDRILEHPSIGVPVRSQLRRFLLRRYPYSLIYTVGDDHILILALMHHRREPGYWKDRT